VTTSKLKELDPSEGIAFFVDGSVGNDKAGGWAWVAIDVKGNIANGYGYADETTIGKMELTAPAQALSHAFLRHGPIDALIYCDSLYVVLGSNDRSRQRRVNHDEWSMLDYWVDKHRAPDKDIRFKHVKGHSGNKYNEQVDKLAVKARKEKLAT
jgi:ribonuclease HI